MKNAGKSAVSQDEIQISNLGKYKSASEQILDKVAAGSHREAADFSSIKKYWRF